MNDEQFLKELGDRMEVQTPPSLEPQYMRNKLDQKSAKKRFPLFWKIAAGVVPVLLLAGFIALYGNSIFGWNQIQFTESCTDYTQVQKALAAIKGLNRYTYGDAKGGAMTAESAQNTTGLDATGYTRTNIQVEGVDEDDIAKTDGTFLYTISQAGGKVIIVRAGASPVITDTISFANMQPVSLYISDSRLTVLYYERVYHPEWKQQYEQKMSGVASGSVTVPEDALYSYGNKMTVMTFSIDGAGKATKAGQVGADGQYVSSRMIGSKLYLITTYYVVDSTSGKAEDYIPATYAGAAKTLIEANDIAIPTYASTASYTLVTAIDTAGSVSVTDSKAVLGYTGVVYANTQNIYVAGASYTGQEQKTQIIRYGIENGKVTYGAQGTVTGYLLNQFSLDEYNGNLRVATTTQPVYSIMRMTEDTATGTAQGQTSAAAGGNTGTGTASAATPSEKITASGTASSVDPVAPDSKPATTSGSSAAVVSSADKAIAPIQNNSKNNIYVLDASLKVIGSVEGLAPGERIYSVRYLGDMAYVVTYRQVDPLFAISLKDPVKPAVLGQLKIPGFSSYLHPWDTGLLFGFGRAATEEGKVQGLKVSMFDITDPVSPSEIAKLAVKDSMTYSAAEYSHKAILIDPGRGIIGIPYLSYTYSGVTNEAAKAAGINNVTTQQGFLILSYTKGTGFTVLGDMPLTSQNYDNNFRGMRIGNTLYVVSGATLTWADLSAPSTVKGNLPL